MRSSSVRTACLALALASLLSACGGSEAKHQAAPSASPSPTPSPTTPSPTASAKPAAVSPLTGLAGPRTCRGLVGKVDNTSFGRPQLGVEKADVVYVEQVEGGVTRLGALFCSHLPDLMGPMRSARTNDVELFAQYGAVGLAYSGANRGVEGVLGRSSLVQMEEGWPGFFRSGGRHAPYNLFVRPAQAISARRVATIGKGGFTFADSLRGGRPASSVRVTFPFATVGFAWAAGEHRWNVYNDGSATFTGAGGHLAAKNVLVQYVHVGRDGFVDVNGNPTPYSRTVGRGRFQLFRDGKVFEGVWVRGTVRSATAWLDAKTHKPLALSPGNTWVVLAPSGRDALIR